MIEWGEWIGNLTYNWNVAKKKNDRHILGQQREEAFKARMDNISIPSNCAISSR